MKNWLIAAKSAHGNQEKGKRISCQGKHREFRNVAKIRGAGNFVYLSSEVLILKMKDVAIFAVSIFFPQKLYACKITFVYEVVAIVQFLLLVTSEVRCHDLYISQIRFNMIFYSICTGREPHQHLS